MRQIAGIIVALTAGCTAMQQDAQVKRHAESVVWGAMGGPSAGLRAQATRIAADVDDPLLDRGLPARLADSSPLVRATAAVALSRQSPVATEVLRAVLDGSDGAAKVIALDAIGTLPDAKERLARLCADADLVVRARVATAVAQWKPTDAAALIGALAHDPDPGVRGQALAALGILDDPDTLGEVTRALEDPSLGVRLAALVALVHVGRSSIGNQLLALADQGGAASNRYLALRAAVQLGHSGRAASALPVVRAAADDHDAAVRVAAMNAAGELGAPGRALALLHLADAELDVRVAAARAIISTGGHDAARNTLLDALVTPRRIDAADELARIGDPRGVEVLVGVAHSSDAAERRRALALLAPLPIGHATLVAALEDPDAGVRLDAAGALLRALFRDPPR